MYAVGQDELEGKKGIGNKQIVASCSDKGE